LLLSSNAARENDDFLKRFDGFLLYANCFGSILRTSYRRSDESSHSEDLYGTTKRHAVTPDDPTTTTDLQGD
jgi:hypothetical protein